MLEYLPTTQRLLDLIEKQPEGGTVDAYFLKEVKKRSGYAVSITNNIVTGKLTIKKLNKVLNRLPFSLYIGYWLDDDKLYIDATHIIKDKKLAIEMARYFKQKSIYDYKNKLTINI